MSKSNLLQVFDVPLNGISLVEASAGTGKTYNITSLYVRAILELNLEPSQILVMTFTEAATAELKLRLRSRLRESLNAVINKDAGEDDFLTSLLSGSFVGAEQKLRNAIELFDESAVFTIHGFCNRLLSEYSLQFDVPPNFELLTDPSEMLQDCVDDYWRTFIKSAEKDDLKWFVLDFLTDVGFGPDELKSSVETILAHPQSKVVPENISISDLQDSLNELEAAFNTLEKHWEREGDIIADMYLNRKLNGTAFRKGKSWEQDWENLKELISSDRPKVNISDRMVRFGSYMKESGSKKDFTVPELDFFRAMDSYVEITDRLKLIKPAFIKDAVEDIREKFKERKRKANVLSYNDLLEITQEGIRNDKTGYLTDRIRESYPLALVDEFQDTDPVQYGIFRKIYYDHPDAGLFMIGDPKQAIYSFRGADIFTYLSAKKDTDKGQSYKLLHNYRSNRRMIEGVNNLFDAADNPFLLEDLSFQSAQFPESKEDSDYIINSSGEVINPLQFIELNDDIYTNKSELNNTIYATVSKEIAEILSGDYTINGEKVREKDIAVLVREGREGEAIQSSLRELGINSVLRSRTSVFKTQEADELFRVLNAIQRISYEPGVRAALATSLLGFTAKDLIDLNKDGDKWIELIQLFIRIREVWKEKGIEAAIDELFTLFNVLQRISEENAAERRISNLIHISELLSKAAREQHLHDKALLKWFYSKVSQDDYKDSSEDEQLRLESDEGLIQITTIHSSKGLQYPVVFCPFLWSSKATPKKDDILKFYKEGLTHIDISQGADHSRNSGHIALTEKQNQAEDVRLTYVALTRAISACYVILPNYRDIDNSPLGFILRRNSEATKVNFGSIKETLESTENIKVRPSTASKVVTMSRDANEKEELKKASFTRNDLFRFPRLLSYSSLSGQKEKREFGKDYDEIEINTVPTTERNDRFGFPKGANAGTCLHNIFEDLNFTDPSNINEVIEQNLNYSGIDERWEPQTIKWISEVLEHPLKSPDISLSKLSDPNVLKEMEFFFPVQNLKAEELWKIIRTESPKSIPGETVQGFMKGYIDLTFRADGKFYILDYKSNFLGDQLDDYGSEKLQRAMEDSGYDLQYHIYTLALHRFLSSRIKDYDYEAHFGGVLYLFLRGVNRDVPGSGVYFDQPDQEVIQKLDQYFKGEV